MAAHTHPSSAATEALVAELHRLGLKHLARFERGETPVPVAPPHLLAALAAHPEARLQGALILLFLHQPEYQRSLTEALQHLDGHHGLSLKLYYQAAVYLQRELAPRLSATAAWQRLPDRFSAELALPPADQIMPGTGQAQPALEALGRLHQQHSGWRYNWSGSYRQHLPYLLK